MTDSVATILCSLSGDLITREWAWFKKVWGWDRFAIATVEDQQKFVFRRTWVYTGICAAFLSSVMGFVGIERSHIISFLILGVAIFWVLDRPFKGKCKWCRGTFQLAKPVVEDKSKPTKDTVAGDEWTDVQNGDDDPAQDIDACSKKPKPTKGTVTLTGKCISFLGFYGVIALAFVFIFQVIQRVWFKQESDAYWYALYFISAGMVSLFLIFPMVRIYFIQKRRGGIPWLTIGFGMGFLVILCAWGLISLYWKMSAVDDIFQKQWRVEECDKTTSAYSSSIGGLAVALSGGGYRAALIHAGLLAYLKDQKVSIDVLSAVSGGSILGAAIAMGVTPTEFAKALYANKPRLPYILMNIC